MIEPFKRQKYLMTWSLRRPARKASALIEERMRLDELELLQKRPSREFLVLMPVS